MICLQPINQSIYSSFTAFFLVLNCLFNVKKRPRPSTQSLRAKKKKHASRKNIHNPMDHFIVCWTWLTEWLLYFKFFMKFYIISGKYLMLSGHSTFLKLVISVVVHVFYLSPWGKCNYIDVCCLFFLSCICTSKSHYSIRNI